MSDLPSDAAFQPGMPDDAAGRPRAPGAWLAAARQENGLTVEQVASQLNLAPRQVAALEADDYAALPGMVIVRGFLRAYAKLLKIDPVPLLALLADPTPTNAAPTRHVTASAFSQTRMPSMHGSADRTSKAPLMALLAVVAVAAGASYALGWWPDALTRRFGQFRGAVITSVGGTSQPGSVDANDAAHAADAGSAAGSAAGVAAGTDGMSGAGAADASTGRPPAAGEPGLTSTTTLSNPVAALVPASAASTASSAPAVAPVLVPAAVAPAGANLKIAPSATAPGIPAPEQKVAPASASGAAAGKAAGSAAANPLVLHVQQDSWIEIKRANNTPMVSRLVKAGSVETFDIDQPVTLIVGNMAGVEASLRGAPLQLESGARGNVSKLRIE